MKLRSEQKGTPPMWETSAQRCYRWGGDQIEHGFSTGCQPTGCRRVFPTLPEVAG